MVAIDLIGLCITIVVAGLRYPHYVMLAVLVHETGRILMALVTNGQIDFIMSAGAFSSATVNNQSDWSLAALIIFSGPLANYVFCASSGGIDQENFSSIANPAAKLTNPFAVVNLRFAVISVLASLWNFL